MHETLSTVDGRSVLRIERRLRHRPEKVWRAITEPEDLRHWFPARMELELTLGAAIRFASPDGDGPTQDGRITEFEPPHRFAFTWDDNLLSFELGALDDGCLLVFTHTFDYRAGAASFAAGWKACFDALDLVLDGRPVETLVPDDMSQVHEAYVAQFGLDRGSEAMTADGWQVTFDRQLTQPVDAVWAALATTEPTVGEQAGARFTTSRVRAGAITTIDAPKLLEYVWQLGDRPGGRVRWELCDGTGQGARLVLTQTGSNDVADARATALDAWQDHIERLAAELARSG
jgi:uncharacterized protein YndB with AHSA1/START domain